MPTVKDRLSGKIISTQPYTKQGEQTAGLIAKANPDYIVSDASARSSQQYAGSGQTGYNSPLMDDIGLMEYEEGGKVGKARKKVYKAK